MARPSLLVRDARADCELPFGVHGHRRAAGSGRQGEGVRRGVDTRAEGEVLFSHRLHDGIYANSKAEVRGHKSDASVSSASPPAAPIPTASLTQTQGFESLLKDSANLKATDVFVHEFDVGKDI